jgi:putative intracellular protease/amidase
VVGDSQREVTVVLFDGFELLDVFGPLEVFGVVPAWFSIRLAGPDAAPVRSGPGPAVVADVSYRDAGAPDIVLVPGGMGTRSLVRDGSFLAWLGGWAGEAEIVTSVCTGSAVLAAAGLLDGFRATSNKLAFSWAVEQGPRVDWVREARWVQDGNRWTSSGVAAGIDMAFALLAQLRGEEAAAGIGSAIEYEWHRDASWDPFAATNLQGR